MSKLNFSVTQTALVFIGVMIGLPIIGAGTALILRAATARPETPPGVTAVQSRVQTPPEPRLQVDPLADRQVVVGPERLASTWGWTDKACGRAHIPVEAAMQRLAQHGWPSPEAGK
ncbi:MAG TPA: hypothetical protein VGM25_17290 [Caulobacteraceae bacterium]|jgi:hypothetical protein